MNNCNVCPYSETLEKCGECLTDKPKFIHESGSQEDFDFQQSVRWDK